MRPVRAFVLYLFFVFAGGALIAPWIYIGLQHASEAWPSLQSIASRSFPRHLNRSLEILAVLGLWWFLRASGLNSWRDLGLGWRSNASAHVAWGFVTGLVSLASIVLIVLACGVRHVSHDHDALSVLAHSARTALSALL